MDTRRKIVTLAATGNLTPRAGGPHRVTVVTGYFDPLLAGHARRLQELADGGCLIVVIEEPERPLLAARARAELVAALAVVDIVVLAEGAAAQQFLDRLQPDRVFREEMADQRRAQDLIAHVRQRTRGLEP